MTGFAFAFYMLMPREAAFSSPISALFKAFVMMIGEYNYEDYFTIEQVEKKESLKKNVNINGTLQILLILFIMLVGIILANLIVALTISKTEELFQKADKLFNIKVSTRGAIMFINAGSIFPSFRESIKSTC